MTHTPDFPAWNGQFATQLQRLRTTTGAALHQLEALFGRWIPRYRLAQEDQRAHSRDRCWNLRLTFWTFLWQVAQAGSSCREAIRQAQSLCLPLGRRVPPDTTSPYCQARAGLPLERLDQIHQGLISEAEAAVATKDLWWGHRVRVVDATIVTLPDTPKNQKAYPQQSTQKAGCGFPLLKLVGLFSLATGLFNAWSTGPGKQHELKLFQKLWDYLQPGEVLLGDRGFGGWPMLAQCLRRAIHGVFRAAGTRRLDWRRGQRLSKDQRLVRWPKSKIRSSLLSQKSWARLPAEITVRLVRIRVETKGFRTRKIILVTTLLDPDKYPPNALAQLYRRRWHLELSLRHLKTTLQMERLSCKTPSMVQRELSMHVLVHNLIRRLMLEAARRASVPLDRVSFAGALATARRTGEALLYARTQRARAKLMAALYRVLAADLVPHRAGRWEPRAVKRRPKPYSLLTCHRSRFREIPHRNRYWQGSPSKRKRAKYHCAN